MTHGKAKHEAVCARQAFDWVRAPEVCDFGQWVWMEPLATTGLDSEIQD